MADTKEMWYYDKEEGIHKSDGESILRQRIERDYGRLIVLSKDDEKPASAHEKNECITHIQDRKTAKREDFNPG